MKDFLGEGGNAGVLSEGLNLLPVKNESCCADMTLTQRLIGVAVCFGLGLVLNLFSMFAITLLFVGKPTMFAIFYTLGNIVSLSGYKYL